MLHEDRHRAGSFGEDAEQYDRARPSYPAALVDDLVEGGVRRVLDVGCGTGIAARLFLARGCTVVGVEADERMADVARRHGVDVDVAPFEDWAPRGGPFDLVVSAQAWHWVDPAIGEPKVHSLLRTAGRFAAFWNEYHHPPEIRAALDPVYRRHAPDLIGNSVATGLQPAFGSFDEPLVRAGFGDVGWHTYRWQRSYTAAAWIDELPTHSDHRTLDPNVRARLLDAIRTVIDDLGGQFTVSMRTRLLRADRWSI